MHLQYLLPNLHRWFSLCRSQLLVIVPNSPGVPFQMPIMCLGEYMCVWVLANYPGVPFVLYLGKYYIWVKEEGNIQSL